MRLHAPIVLVIASMLALLFVISFDAEVRADPNPVEQSHGSMHEEVADDSDVDDGRARPRFDYSRFSDGPRRVPTPRGASKIRAEALSLGTRECASRLLHGAPDEAWVQAAGGRTPSRLLWPVDDGRWVRGFGYVRTTRPDLIHRGVDIAADPGTVVRAAADGIVAYSDNEVRGFGNVVLIVHANGWVSLYAHNSRTTVQPGYRVRRGERIGLVGQTGIARGPHLHFELWENGRARNPANLFDGGPRFVQRLAERAASLGRVPPPSPVTAADRPDEAPLAPYSEARVSTEATPVRHEPSAEAQTDAPTSAPAVRAIESHALGSLALVRRLLSRRAPANVSELVPGPIFSTLLFPVRDGSVTQSFGSSRRPMQVSGAPNAAIRASADALVVFAGELPGRGNAVVLLHRNSWVTSYVGAGTIAATPGQQVTRGAWIGRMGETPIAFELHVSGHARNPESVLVQPQ